MPAASSIKFVDGVPPNSFVSPFTDQMPPSFYSSITVQDMRTQDCLPCAMTGVSRQEVENFIIQLAQASQFPPGNSITVVDNPPVIPPPPSPATEIIDVPTEIFVGIFNLARPVLFLRMDSQTT